MLGMRHVLRSAAWLLPRQWALLVADIIALILSITPVPGFSVMHEMQRAFGVRRTTAFRLSWGWLAIPLRDFVVYMRVILGRETENTKVIERNAESISALRTSGESYIVATAHFAREASINMHSPRVTPGHVLLLTDPLPPRIDSIYHSRIRLQLATVVEALYRAHGGNMKHVTVGSEPPAAATLYANLRKPGNVAVITIDTPWQRKGPGSFARPFAGFKSLGFSLGAIGLARLAQCAIISCIIWRENDGTVVLDWGDPIRPALRGTKVEDISIMNKLLDRLEVAIGRRPTQYLLEICGQRRWNPYLEHWQDP